MQGTIPLPYLRLKLHTSLRSPQSIHPNNKPSNQFGPRLILYSLHSTGESQSKDAITLEFAVLIPGSVSGWQATRPYGSVRGVQLAIQLTLKLMYVVVDVVLSRSSSLTGN